MNIKTVNKVLLKLSNEIEKLNKEHKTDIAIFYEDNGAFNHVIFDTIEDENNNFLANFDLYYKPSFYVNLSDNDNLDSEEIKKEIKLNDETMTDEKIEQFFNNNLTITNWAFETCIRNHDGMTQQFNYINNDNIDLVVSEIIEDIKNYLEI